MNRNLCKKILSNGGSIIPLLIDPKDSKGLGLMNPSILLDNDKLLLNLRNINYTLYHCEGEQLFNNRWGPLSYLHPEHDMHLRTYNFMCELNSETLEIEKYWLTDTKDFDKEPLWDFVGLEDARLVRWDGKLFQCGVRRDTTTNGQGRMELTELLEKDEEELEKNESKYKEISRTRIEPPGKSTYCEKNWMPVIDMPYHFVKWTNPTQVVKVNPLTKMSETVFMGTSHIPDVRDFRGGSQVIPWKNYRICLLHEVNLFNNKLEQKDATYWHRFMVWDKDWNMIKMSDPFSFMDGEIEFGCGLTFYKGDMLVTFGFQDNAAFVLKIPESMIEEMLGFKKNSFKWGAMNKNPDLKRYITKEIFEDNGYQRYFKVEKGDIVVDVGASVAPFTHSILKQKPERVFAIEPDNELFPTLYDNVKHNNSVICINKGIHSKDEKFQYGKLWNKFDYGDGITFKSFLKKYNIEKIDFLKLDCEGAEYDILNDENFNWIVKNVKKISAEFHINTMQNKELKEKFVKFRDTYLKYFDNYKVISIDGIDIKWDLWNDHFINYYGEVMIYIDNTKNKIKDVGLNFDIKKTIPLPKQQDPDAKWKYSKWPTLEITTIIPEKGCPVDCAFCPQRVLQKAYKGERILTLENFKKAIDKVPQDVTIIFSGFSEPWINKSATDMVLYAHEKKHDIAIFTTGIGMTKTDINKLKKLKYPPGALNPSIGSNGFPMQNGGFILHLPDNEGYSKHPITKRYIELLKYIASIKDEISGFRTTCMGIVHDKIKDIFEQPSINLAIWSRANNLVKEEKLKPEVDIKNKYNQIYHGTEPITCGCDEELYHNVLLPNGDVVLCCMDYNLDHVLGNLFKREYNDILPDIKTPFEICRYCENGIQVKLKI